MDSEKEEFGMGEVLDEPVIIKNKQVVPVNTFDSDNYKSSDVWGQYIPKPPVYNINRVTPEDIMNSNTLSNRLHEQKMQAWRDYVSDKTPEETPEGKGGRRGTKRFRKSKKAKKTKRSKKQRKNKTRR